MLSDELISKISLYNRHPCAELIIEFLKLKCVYIYGKKHTSCLYFKQPCRLCGLYFEEPFHKNKDMYLPIINWRKDILFHKDCYTKYCDQFCKRIK